jgi:hypothetical protein
MTILTTLTQDILKYHIIPFFSVATAGVFGQVSKAAFEILVVLAKSPHDDINLAGKSITKIPGSIRAYLKQKCRMDAFRENPDLQYSLQRARKEIMQALGKRDDMNTLIDHAHRKITDSMYQANLASALVLIGLDRPRQAPSGKPDADLGQALIKAMKTHQHQIVQAVLYHPNAINISEKGMFGLGAAVNIALNAKNYNDALKILRSPPYAGKIPAEDGVFGLNAILIKAIKSGHAELVETILIMPNATNIPFEGKEGLVEAISIASKLDNTDIISLLSSFWDNK